MPQQLNVYGSQPTPMPGQANVGYGPAGQHYNMLNPVVMTTSGLRPLSVANTRVQPHNAAPGTVSQQTLMQQANYRAPAWTAQGRQQGGFLGAVSQAAGAGGNPNIQTSITPQNIYSPQQTQEAVNSAVASQHVPLPWLQSRYAGRGMSVNSPGVIGASMPAYAAGIAGGQQAAAQIPFQDALANAQHQLAGQSAREGEAVDIYRILSGQDSVNRGFQMNSLQSLLSLLGAFA